MSTEKTLDQRLAELQADTISLQTQQAARIGAAWEVLYRMGGTMTRPEYEERASKLRAAEQAITYARTYTDAGFAMLRTAIEQSPQAPQH